MKTYFSIVAIIIGFITHSTAIATTTINIEPSRVTGVAPLAVFFDATGTISTATTKPFHEVNYAWDFGDPTAGNWQYGNVYLTDKNIDYGPVSSHIFETPGLYTVTLRVKDTNGDTDVETVNITVSDPDTVYFGTNTVCYSNDSDFAGCPSGAKQTITASFSSLSTDIGTNKRMLFKAGDNFDAPDKIEFQVNGPSIISSFGIGQKPIIDHIEADAQDMFQVELNIHDWRITNLHFTNSTDTDPKPHIVEVLGGVTDLLFYQNENSPSFRRSVVASGFANRDDPLPNGLFFVDNYLSGFGGHVIYGASKRWVIMGNFLDNTIEFGGEHIVRLIHVETGVISHNHLSKPLINKAVLTLRNVNHQNTCNFCQNDTANIVVADNEFYSGSNRTISVVDENGSGAIVHGNNIIIERNFFTQGASTPNETRTAINAENMDDLVVRNNVLLMDEWGGYAAFQMSQNLGDVYLYNNSCYTDDVTSGSNCVLQAPNHDTGTIFASNNLNYSPNVTGTAFAVNGDFTGSNNLVADINPFITTLVNSPEDYALTAGSVAENTGAPIPVFIDYAGNERTGVMDVGAFDQSSTLSDLIFLDGFESN